MSRHTWAWADYPGGITVYRHPFKPLWRASVRIAPALLEITDDHGSVSAALRQAHALKVEYGTTDGKRPPRVSDIIRKG